MNLWEHRKQDLLKDKSILFVKHRPEITRPDENL